MLGEQPHPAQHLLGVGIAVSLAAVSGPLLDSHACGSMLSTLCSAACVWWLVALRAAPST